MKNPALLDVRARRKEISEQVATLKSEDAELATAEKVLLRLAGPAAEEPEEEPSAVEVVKSVMKGNETLEELIKLLMENCIDDWWTAAEVQECLTLLKGRDVPMASVSPTLSNMKTKGTVVRDGLNVGLATRHPNKEAATG